MKKIIVALIVGLLLGVAGKAVADNCMQCFSCSGTGQKWTQCYSCNGQGGSYSQCFSCSGRGEKCF